MKKYCINYKLFLLELLPFLGALTSTCFFLFSYGSGVYIGFVFLLLSLSNMIILLYIEPILFVIDNQGIMSVGFFKKLSVTWKEIKSIEVRYDPFFKVLFVKDYVLTAHIAFNCPRRFFRVLKCHKTQLLLKQNAPTNILK